METNLEKCKKVALDYLHSEIYPTKLPIFVIHPFFESTIFPYKDGFADIKENEEAQNEIYITCQNIIENDSLIKEKIIGFKVTDEDKNIIMPMLEMITK